MPRKVSRWHRWVCPARQAGHGQLPPYAGLSRTGQGGSRHDGRAPTLRGQGSDQQHAVMADDSHLSAVHAQRDPLPGELEPDTDLGAR